MPHHLHYFISITIMFLIKKCNIYTPLFTYHTFFVNFCPLFFFNSLDLTSKIDRDLWEVKISVEIAHPLIKGVVVFSSSPQSLHLNYCLWLASKSSQAARIFNYSVVVSSFSFISLPIIRTFHPFQFKQSEPNPISGIRKWSALK